jgi:hypothetical protein
LSGWLITHSKAFGRFADGEKIPLYEKGRFVDAKLKKALLPRKT